MDSLSLLANNLANAGTAGFKMDHEFYGAFTSANAEDETGGGGVASLPVIDKQWTDFSQGTLQTTGSPLDIGLSGRGFLAVNGPGGTVYTRNGNMRVSPAGELITGSEGYPLRSVAGDTFHVSTGKSIEISRDGTVSQNGQSLGQIEIVDFKSTDSLKKMTGAVFQNTDPKNTPIPATNIEVEQGKTESSNVGVPESAMRMVGMMRQFEMLQKAITLNSSMNQKALEEVARIPT
jgi:flagellar basal-body rod protein FlgF